MSWQAWVTLVVICGVLALLIRGRTSPALVVFGGTIALLTLGVITTEQALSGFSNPAPVTVAALYVVAAAVQKTGALTPLLHGALGKQPGVRRPFLRLSIPLAGASAFLNNTPIVAMLIPEVQSWAERRRASVSKLLMPLAFAVVLGGMVTVIGTSTNLVVSGLMVDAGLEPMGFFEIGKVGLPVAIVGLIVMVVILPWAMPNRRSVRAELDEDSKRFYVEMIVVPGGPVDGATVESAELRDLQGVFLTSVDRGDTVIAPARSETVLRGGNRLRFAGQSSRVLDLQDRRGLELAASEHVSSLSDPSVSYFEAVIGSRSPLVGSTLKQAGFRSNYQAAVVAIHRDGDLVDAKLGEVKLRVGDTLILVSDPGFRRRWSDRDDFLLIAPMDGAPSLPIPTAKAWLAVGVLAAIVLLAALNVVPILIGSLVGAVVLVGTKVLSSSEARRSVDIEVVVIIAAAFGLAAGMQSSGLAATLASGISDLFGNFGDRGALLGIVLATVLLTQVIANNAAALLMFPIGITIATQPGLSPVGVAIAIAISASTAFLTPVGYQANTMVYGPGGYRFSDYFRIGLPLTMAVVAVVVWLVPVMWP